MNQVITNTDDRRLSMVYFAGLFLLAVAIPCLAFIKSSNLAYTLPKEELAVLKEKERILKSFAELSYALRQYETAQTMESSDLYDKASLCGDLSMRLHSELRNKDTFRIYKDVVQFLSMADQYKAYIAKSSRNLDEKTKAIELGNAQLLNDKMALQNENTALKIALASAPKGGGGGGGGGAAPAPIYIPAPAPAATTAAAAPSQPLIIPTPNTGNADCDGKISQIKSSFKAMCLDMRSKITQVQTDVKSISKGLLGGNKAEKQRIEMNLNLLDRQLEGSLSN
jgi:hypothetical protein